METPSSARRVTRSQTLAVQNSNHSIPISRKMENSGNAASKSRQRNAKQQQQQDRSALIDITNDSPIGGLAMGSLQTPSSGVAKQRNSLAKNSSTPGSGEALLRGQVKTLLQKVEEEAELSKLALEIRPFLHLQGPVNSPMGLLAPTPANTPKVPDLTDSTGLSSESPLAVVEEQLISQVVSDIFDGNKQESLESQKSLTRSLLLDFSEKSESADSSECSVLTECKQKPNEDDDDDASIWSIQVNASTHDEDEEDVNEEAEVEDGEEDEDYYYEEDDDEGSSVDALCEGFSKIGVMDTNKFAGKHIRFVYDSDGEIVKECVENEDSASVLRLKGLPTPKGKHIRFNVEEEEEDD